MKKLLSNLSPNLRRFVLVGTILFGVAVVSFAFRKTMHFAHAHRTEHMVEKMTEELDLTPEQVEQVQALANKMHARKKAMFENHDGDREAMKEKMMAMHQELEGELQSILTEEQWAKWLTIRPEPGHHFRGRGGCASECTDGKGGKQAMKKELMEYGQQNIVPVLQADRIAFDAQLSEEEKQLIAKMREHGPMHRGGEHGPAEQRYEGRGHHRGEHRAAMKTMLEKHGPAIDQILEKYADERVQWQADMKAIIESHMGELPAGMEPHGKHHQFKQRMLFLMMDPNGVNGNLVELPAPKVYPIPAENANKIELELPQAATVKIDLLDKDGQFIRNVQEEQLPKGQHVIPVELSELKPGTYYFEIYMEDQRFVKRFVKN